MHRKTTSIGTAFAAVAAAILTGCGTTGGEPVASPSSSTPAAPRSTTFANAAGLEAIGDNLFLQTEASGEAVGGNPGAPGFGRVVQGALETSNVNIVQEITTLISAQRAYEMNSKVIKTTDEMMQQASQLR